ncbi:unnamed protein product [Calicophoron daubneyi]|uniref:Homeobox domain-containing protein n=1 Tax=Calicophoron daubneyi TaxID=300641 RepID=A0AAV2TCZ8_CALDB
MAQNMCSTSYFALGTQKDGSLGGCSEITPSVDENTVTLAKAEPAVAAEDTNLDYWGQKFLGQNETNAAVASITRVMENDSEQTQTFTNEKETDPDNPHNRHFTPYPCLKQVGDAQLACSPRRPRSDHSIPYDNTRSAYLSTPDSSGVDMHDRNSSILEEDVNRASAFHIKTAETGVYRPLDSQNPCSFAFLPVNQEDSERMDDSGVSLTTSSVPEQWGPHFNQTREAVLGHWGNGGNSAFCSTQNAPPVQTYSSISLGMSCPTAYGVPNFVGDLHSFAQNHGVWNPYWFTPSQNSNSGNSEPNHPTDAYGHPNTRITGTDIQYSAFHLLPGVSSGTGLSSLVMGGSAAKWTRDRDETHTKSYGIRARRKSTRVKRGLASPMKSSRTGLEESDYITPGTLMPQRNSSVRDNSWGLNTLPNKMAQDSVESVDENCDDQMDPLVSRHGLSESNSSKFASKNRPLNQIALRELERWYTSHVEHPYPNSDEKEQLAGLGHITVAQVSSWFANRRTRSANTWPKKNRKMLLMKIAQLTQRLENETNGLLSAANLQFQLESLLKEYLP